MNVLPIIADWLSEFPYHDTSDMKRVDLVAWLRKRYRNDSPIVLLTQEEVELAADCLIAAGIGREQEQTATVYCRCSHG